MPKNLFFDYFALTLTLPRGFANLASIQLVPMEFQVTAINFYFKE